MFVITRFTRNASFKQGWEWASCACCSSKATLEKNSAITERLTNQPLIVASMGAYGQPTHTTHPHLVQPDELVPGLKRSEFAERRERLMSAILRTAPKRHHCVVVAASPKQYMTEQIPYVYRQHTDMRYLSGCLETDTALLLYAGAESPTVRSTMFIRKQDPRAELWDGPRTGVERAPQVFGVDNALALDDLQPFLTSLSKAHKPLTLWYDHLKPVHNGIHKSIHAFMTEVALQDCKSPCGEIQRLRLIKSPAEQALMRSTCQVASKAIAETMAWSQPGHTEAQLFARVDYECRLHGAEMLAYPPVVAAGDNANTIHYIENNQMTRSGDLVLMDAGCELHGYTSDITRTWPVDGQFTEPQRTLYEVVLSVQADVIAAAHKRPPLNSLFDTMCQLLGERLLEAHVLARQPSTDTNLAQIGYSFCPHHVSHYLGMDVHDTALIARSIPLQTGMVFTIEPGVYVSRENKLAREEFRGLAIRIEDDVLITNSGPDVLSNCVKEVEDIESLCRRP